MSEEDTGDKEFDASQKRLDDARARGEIPKSQDLAAAASYAGFALACLLAGAAGIIAFGNAFSTVLGQAERLAPMVLRAAPAPTAAIGWGGEGFQEENIAAFLCLLVVAIENEHHL
jgi:flagellar biosynthetic protein FlhB